MPSFDQPPHRTVQADLRGIADYTTAVEVFAGRDYVPIFRELGDLLAHRAGWHFEATEEGKLLWSLGSFGGSGLNISITREMRFSCYDHRTEEDAEVYDSLREVEEWVTGREEAALAHVKAVQRNWSSADDWRLLRLMDYELRIDWFEGQFVATVAGIPTDATFAATLSGVIRAGRQLITGWFDAPSAMAERLVNVTVNLTPKAAVQVAAHTDAD